MNVMSHEHDHFDNAGLTSHFVNVRYQQKETRMSGTERPCVFHGLVRVLCHTRNFTGTFSDEVFLWVFYSPFLFRLCSDTEVKLGNRQ